MDLSIIIVNWKSVHLLRKCLDSIFANSAQLQLEVLVIDNASYDGSADMVSKYFPSVTFIQSEENLGFAGANNRAYQQSRGNNILFLNPDTEILGDALQQMMHLLENHEDAGMVGPKLLNADRSEQTLCARTIPTIASELFDSAVTRRLFSKTNFWGNNLLPNGAPSPVSVMMLPGTCILIRRSVFGVCGGFNESYFMYAEDVELSYRIKSAGWSIYYLGNAAVIHHGGRSASQTLESHFSTVMTRESLWKFLLSNRGPVYASAYRATTMVAAVARILVLGAMGILPLGTNFRLNARRGIRKWVKVWRWCVGLENWTRKCSPPERRPSVTAAP